MFRYCGSQPQSQVSPLIHVSSALASTEYKWWRIKYQKSMLMTLHREFLDDECSELNGRKRYRDVHSVHLRLISRGHSLRRIFDIRLSHLIYFLKLVSCSINFAFSGWLRTLHFPLALIIEKFRNAIQHSWMVVSSVDSILNIWCMRENKTSSCLISAW